MVFSLGIIFYVKYNTYTQYNSESSKTNKKIYQLVSRYLLGPDIKNFLGRNPN